MKSTMPQLTNSIALPMNNDAIDKDEAKYSGDAHFRITSVRSEYVNNNVDSDIVLNCDNLNLIEIKEELLDTFEMPAIADKDLLLSSCDTTTTAANATNAENGAKMKTTNNNTTYLCHRCRQMFSSRDQFEVHYRYNKTISLQFNTKRPILIAQPINCFFFLLAIFCLGNRTMRHQFTPVIFATNK